MGVRVWAVMRAWQTLCLCPRHHSTPCQTKWPSKEAACVCMWVRFRVCISRVARVARLYHFQSGHRTYEGGSILTMIGGRTRLKLRLRL